MGVVLGEPGFSDDRYRQMTTAPPTTRGTSGHATYTWQDESPTFVPSRLKSIKLWMLKRAKSAGLFRIIRDSGWRGKRLLILAYHGISLFDEHEWSPELYMRPEAVRGRFEMLRSEGYNVLSLREGIARLHAGTLPPRAVAITFDDGMVDFKLGAVPLLQEFGYPATVYVTTYYAQKQVPIFRIACRYMLWAGRGTTIDGTDLTLSGVPMALESEEQRNAARMAMEERLARMHGGLEEEVSTLRRLAGRVNVDFDRFLAERRLQVMSPLEISSLPSDLVEVQLHTHRHRVPLKEQSFLRELDDNRRALQESLPGATLDGFCYPSGVTNRRFLPWLREQGIKTGLTCEPGLASASADPLLLPRLVDTSGLTRLEFESWLTGVGALLPIRQSAAQPAPVRD